MHRKKPTLQDVANLAGVSTATVSRCLNQPDVVKTLVQERINAAIAELGYVPHGAARALASRRTHTVGAVVPTIDNAIFSEAIQYLQRGLGQAGFTLLLANSGYSPETELREVQALLSRGVDGLVLVGAERDPAVYEAIAQQGIPHVNLWVYDPESAYSCIGLDNRAAGRQLAEHLYQLGHRQIGIVTAIRIHNDRAKQRLEGVQGFLQEYGIHLSEQQIIECRYSGAQGKQATQALLARNPTLTAVICGNDILALGALAAADSLGLKVPDDLSITGFDNLEIISVLRPALTTIHVPSRRMGQQAAEYLLRQIAHNTRHVEHLQLETRLIIRETTAEARG